MTTAQTTRTPAQQAAYTRKVNRAMTKLAFDDAAERERVLLADRDRLRAALADLAATARTFRNVPQDQQQWTSLDDAALDQAFAALAQSHKGE